MNGTRYVLVRSIIELFIATSMYAIKLPKKKYFAFRLVFCAAICLCFSIFINRIGGRLWGQGFVAFDLFFNPLKFVLFLTAIMLSLKFCLKISLMNAVFFTVAGRATQDIAAKIYFIIDGEMFGVLPLWGSILIYVAVYAAVYVLVYFALCRKIEGYDFDFIHKAEGILIIFGIIMSIVVGQFGDYFRDETQLAMLVILSASSVLIDLFILTILFQTFKTNREEQLKKQLEVIRLQEEKQFEYSKETIELINVKCHDLKHMLGYFEDRLSKAEIDELKSKVNVYSSSVKTGNKILDVVLAEKSLYAEKFSITVTGMADGKALGFLIGGDLYSLLGNAFDNALEACKEVENKDARFISYNIRRVGEMCLIRVENSFAGEIEMNGEYPVSKKSDDNNHGFGVRSIAFTVKKYGGAFSIDAQDGIFRLNITIPVKERKNLQVTI